MEDRLDIKIRCITFEKINEIETRMIKSGEIKEIGDLDFMIQKLCDKWLTQDTIQEVSA